MRTILAAILSLVASAAFATSVTDDATAGVKYSGGASISSESRSSVYGPGYSKNTGDAGSYQYGAAYAKTTDNYNRNGYDTGLVLRNEVWTGSTSVNLGPNASGYSDNHARAGARGRAYGRADSTTSELADAHSDARGHVDASVNSHSKTGYGPWWRNEVQHYGAAHVDLYLEGRAGTSAKPAASSKADGYIWTYTESDADRLWGRGHVHGRANAGGSGQLHHNGSAGDVPVPSKP